MLKRKRKASLYQSTICFLKKWKDNRRILQVHKCHEKKKVSNRIHTVKALYPVLGLINTICYYYYYFAIHCGQPMLPSSFSQGPPPCVLSQVKITQLYQLWSITHQQATSMNSKATEAQCNWQSSSKGYRNPGLMEEPTPPELTSLNEGAMVAAAQPGCWRSTGFGCEFS